jgi:hypothetical protein
MKDEEEVDDSISDAQAMIMLEKMRAADEDEEEFEKAFRAVMLVSFHLLSNTLTMKMFSIFLSSL